MHLSNIYIIYHPLILYNYTALEHKLFMYWVEIVQVSIVLLSCWFIFLHMVHWYIKLEAYLGIQQISCCV